MKEIGFLLNDAQVRRDCLPLYENYCIINYNNGHCDHGCNTEECAWDGIDCDKSSSGRILSGSLVFIILVPLNQLPIVLPGFLRQLSILLRGYLTVKRDDQEREMVYQWPGKHIDHYKEEGSEERNRLQKRASSSGLHG